MTQKFDWTLSAEAKLRDLWASGVSATVISKAFNGAVSRDAVIGKANRLGLPGRRVGRHVRRPSGPPSMTAGVVKSGGTGGGLRFGRHEPGVKPPTPLAAPEVVPVGVPGGVAFADLKPGHCRFDVSGARHPENYRFCGADRESGSAYCAAHRAKTIDKAATRSAEKRSERAASYARRKGVA